MIGICVRRREHVSCAYHAYQFAHQKVITPESIRFIGCQRYVTWQKTLFTCGQLLLVYLVASLCVVCCLRCALFKYQTVWNFISQFEQLCEEIHSMCFEELLKAVYDRDSHLLPTAI